MKPQDLLARLEAGYAYDPMYGELCNERDRLSDENAKLRELMAKQAKILGVGTGWCYADCAREFECDMDECKIESAMNELGMAHELAALLGVKKGADA